MAVPLKMTQIKTLRTSGRVDGITLRGPRGPKNKKINGGGNTHTSKNSLREPQHSVSAPAHSFVIEPIPATSPQNGASSPDVVLVEKSFGSIHTKNKELEIEIIEAQKDSNRVANDKKCPSQ